MGQCSVPCSHRACPPEGELVVPRPDALQRLGAPGLRLDSAASLGAGARDEKGEETPTTGLGSDQPPSAWNLSTHGSAAEGSADEDAEAGGDGLPATPSAASGAQRARELLGRLRVCEAAEELGRENSADWSPRSDEALRSELRFQLEQLQWALGRLAEHPGMQALHAGGSEVEADAGCLSQALLGVPLPPGPLPSAPEASPKSLAKRDVMEITIDLDDEGRQVDAFLEFLPNGTISGQWVAKNLPIPLPLILCMVQEVDLVAELLPFVVSAGLVHQFPSNEADRLVRIASKPPIPFVAGFEAVAQRLGFDLLDTPWKGLCLVECGPTWGAQAGDTPRWRGVAQPASAFPSFKQVDVKSIAALARPGGENGELTTIVVSVTVDAKLPRSLLPQWLVAWLAKTIGRFIYQRALEHVSKFDSTEHGRRLREHDTSFYSDLHHRLEEFVRREAEAGRRDAEPPWAA